MSRAVSIGSTQEIPLICEVDILVIGGGLAGVAAASDLAKAGRQVLLVESNTFVGHEFGAWQRPWVEWRREHQELLREWLPVEGAEEGEIVPLHMDTLKLKLEDSLLESGAQVLYASRPVGHRREGQKWLVFLGNKSGRQAVRTKHVIDATETGIMSWLSAGAGAKLDSASGQSVTVRRTIEFTGVRREGVRDLEVPPALGIAGNSVTVYPGGFSADHVYVDVPLAVEMTGPPSPRADFEIEMMARTRSLEVAAYLVKSERSFSKAKIGLGSVQVMRGGGFDAAAAIGQGRELATSIAGDEPAASKCYRLTSTRCQEIRLPDSSADQGEATLPDITYEEQNELAAEWAGERLAAPASALELLADVDVTVVGGGTSGAPAARAAASEGVNTALVEMNSSLGGTGTVGSVCVYWMTSPNLLMTSPNAFSDDIDRRVGVWGMRVGRPTVLETWVRKDSRGKDYWWGEDTAWSIEVKAHVLLEMCHEAGVAVFLNSFCIGTLVDAGKVVGVVVATPYGPRAILSDVTIDATGDGDMAAFAGAEYVYGSERDRMTMWACLPFHREPGGHGSHFTSTVDVGDIFDYTRFILTCRRRGGRLHDHGTYIGPRESRHILGETMITLEDQLLLTHYPDTVAMMFSNYDMKGQHVADIVDFGVNPPHFDMEIPYSALVPKGLDQLLIAGKAFSVTHDASAAPRMQRDLQLLGGVVGTAAAQAARDAVTVKTVDVAKLQRALVESGNLPERVLRGAPSPAPSRLHRIVAGLTGDERFEWLHMLATERITSVPPLVRLCCAEAQEVVPLLRGAFETSTGELRLLLARLLLWHGSADGLDVVLEEIERQWKEHEALPECTRDVWWVTGVPEHGVMPEMVHLLYALTRVKDPRVIAPFEQLVARVERVERDYSDLRIRVFDYIHIVALAAERLGQPQFAPLLERLLALPELQESLRQPSIGTDDVEERKAYLVVCLARSLARCGRKEGLLKLAELVSDDRAVISKSACQELRALTNMDHPRSREVWHEALQDYPSTFAPVLWEKELA